MPINIEITSTPDYALLADIHAASFEKSWDAKAFQDVLAIEGTKAFVAKPYKGFALVRMIEEEAEILTLAVAASCRRQGIAKALAMVLLDWTAEQKVKTVFLEVRKSNMAAIRLYQKIGFCEFSSRKDYYRNQDGTCEDAVIMRFTS